MDAFDTIVYFLYSLLRNCGGMLALALAGYGGFQLLLRGSFSPTARQEAWKKIRWAMVLYLLFLLASRLIAYLWSTIRAFTG